MTDTPTPPGWATVPRTTVRWSLARVDGDTTDVAVGDLVYLTPSVSGIAVVDPLGVNPVSVVLEQRAYRVRADGALVNEQDDLAAVLAVDDPRVATPGGRPVQWLASHERYRGQVRFPAADGETVELSRWVAAKAPDATQRSWAEQLIDAAEDVTAGLAAAVGAGEAAVAAAGQAAGSATSAADSAATATEQAGLASTARAGAETARDAASVSATEADNDRIAAIAAKNGAETARDETVQVVNSIAITADATDVAPGTPADVNVTGEAPQYHFGFEVPRGRDAYIEGATPPADTGMLWLDTGTPSLPESGSPFELRGYGMPNGVVSATPGTYYTDNLGTNGVWRWLKTSGTGTTGWIIVLGDTGTLTVPTTHGIADLNIPSVNLRRMGNWCVVWFNASSAGVLANTTYDLLTLPVGFRAPGHWQGEGSYGAGPHVATPFLVGLWAGRGLWVQSTTAMSIIKGHVAYPTSDPWPTTLPGTAA